MLDNDHASLPVDVTPIEPQCLLGSQAGLTQQQHHGRRPSAVRGRQAGLLFRREVGGIDEGCRVETCTPRCSHGR